MLSKKLRLKEDTRILVINPPADFKRSLGEVPKGVTVSSKPAKKNDFIMLFVQNKKQLEAEIVKSAKMLAPGGLFWICYPKGSSGIQTDLTRDKGWECLDKVKMQWLALISFDDNWSAFLMRNEAPKEQSKASKDYHAISQNYADPKTKTVVVPEDLAKAFEKNKTSGKIFDALSFTCRKEYVMWIVGAKREETRKERIQKTIAKLKAGKKTPAEK